MDQTSHKGPSFNSQTWAIPEFWRGHIQMMEFPPPMSLKFLLILFYKHT